VSGGADSVTDLAGRVGRKTPQVSNDLSVLEDAGIVHFRDGDGRAKAPFVPYQRVHIEAEEERVGILDVVPGFVTTQIVATASNAMSVRVEVVALRETLTTVHDQSIPEARHHIVVD
jgi:DNA-binding transcriptional ArsR family regulator